MKKPAELVARLHALDRRTAWAFSPWTPVAAAAAAFIICLFIRFLVGPAGHGSAWIATGGAIMACCGIFALARPVIRAGGYIAWLEKTKVFDGGHFPPTPEELDEASQDRRDAFSVNVIGPALAISGTLINGASGFFG